MRRLNLLLTVLLISVFVLSACASPAATPAASSDAPVAGDSTAPTSEEQSADPIIQPEEEKVLRFIHGLFDMDWSPLRGGGWPVRYLSMFWAPPMWVDMEGTIHPGVFNEWSSNADYTVWTFKIDPNAKFSDGSAITSADVKGTWELASLPSTQHQRVSLFLAGVEGFDAAKVGDSLELPGVVAVDASTIEVNLTAPDPVFSSRIATNLLPPVKISQARGADGKEVADWWHVKNNPAYSGPFMPVSMDLDRGEQEYVKNPNWWGPEPKIDRLTFVTVEDMQTQTLMLQQGEADVAVFLDLPTTHDDLGPEFVGTNQPATPVFQYFWINSYVAPMDDINCRKALIMSVNIEEMFKVSKPFGPGSAGSTLLAPIVGDAGASAFPYDPEAAKAAFAECSYSAAMPRIILAGISNPSAQAAGEYIVEQWRQVLGITEVELNAKFDELAKTDQGKVQIFRDDTGTRFPDAVSVLQATVYSKSGNAQTKMGNYLNAALDAKIEEAATKTSDDPLRLELAIEAEKIVMEDWVFLPWYNEGPLMRAMPYVTGYAKNLDWQVMEPWNLDIVK
jgi:peptide/nickel transport system substrate-binding protein